MLNKHKIVFRILIVIAVFACLTSVYCLNPQPDNIVNVANIEFNTSHDSNVSKFDLYSRKDYDVGAYHEVYLDEDFTGYAIYIWNTSEGNEWDNFSSYVKELYVDDPSETINGVVIYNVTEVYGEHAGEPRFLAFVVNNDLKTIVEFYTPSQNETLKIASSLRFV